MSNTEAYSEFCKLRWPATNGEAVCPKCGCVETYDIPTRRKFKCAACYHQFSATSGTIFHGRKLPYASLMVAIRLVAEGASASAIARALNVQVRSGWYLAKRIAEGNWRTVE